MQKDTRTRKKIPHSSLCREMSFSVPTGWKELTQEQFRFVMRIIWLFSVNSVNDAWKQRAMSAVLVRFLNIEVMHNTDSGWMCREKKSGGCFILDPELLPSMMEKISWAVDTDNLTVRIDKVGEYHAVDFKLQELPFGEYLMAENFFQAYLIGKEEKSLVGLARVLYRIPDDASVPELREEVLLATFLWFNAVKQELGRQFPHFLKLSGEQGEAVTKQSLVESMRAQIRLLTKGDVTKEQYVRDNVDTWTAMAELDALAKEAEEIKQKYGNK